jgi:hypothetical protein
LKEQERGGNKNCDTVASFRIIRHGVLVQLNSYSHHNKHPSQLIVEIKFNKKAGGKICDTFAIREKIVIGKLIIFSTSQLAEKIYFLTLFFVTFSYLS